MGADNWAVVREESEAIRRPCVPGAVEKLANESREIPKPVTNTRHSALVMRTDCADSRKYTPYTRHFVYTRSLRNARKYRTVFSCQETF